MPWRISVGAELTDRGHSRSAGAAGSPSGPVLGRLAAEAAKNAAISVTRSAPATQSASLVLFALLFLTPNFVRRSLLTRPMEVAATYNPVTYLMEAGVVMLASNVRAVRRLRLILEACGRERRCRCRRAGGHLTWRAPAACG